ICLLAAGCGADDIGEQDRDRLADLAAAQPWRRRQRVATGVAEAGALAVLGSAARAADHLRSLRADTNTLPAALSAPCDVIRCVLELEPTEGVEPTTGGLQNRCSTVELRRPGRRF